MDLGHQIPDQPSLHSVQTLVVPSRTAGTPTCQPASALYHNRAELTNGFSSFPELKALYGWEIYETLASYNRRLSRTYDEMTLQTTASWGVLGEVLFDVELAFTRSLVLIRDCESI